MDNEGLRQSAHEMAEMIAQAFEVPLETVLAPPEEFEAMLDRLYPID